MMANSAFNNNTFLKNVILMVGKGLLKILKAISANRAYTFLYLHLFVICVPICRILNDDKPKS